MPKLKNASPHPRVPKKCARLGNVERSLPSFLALFCSRSVNPVFLLASSINEAKHIFPISQCEIESRRHSVGSLRTREVTADQVSAITVQPLSHHTGQKDSEGEGLTACGQNPCPGPAWLNVSFVSGCLGFPPERQYNDNLRRRDASRIISKNRGVAQTVGLVFYCVSAVQYRDPNLGL